MKNGSSTQTKKSKPLETSNPRGDQSVIIHDLPFFGKSTSVQVGRRAVTVKQDQIIVWVSIAEKGLSDLRWETPRFPAILDTGCTHGFLIQERHLVDWAGIHPRSLQRLRPTRVYGVPVPQLAANVWLHPNRRGQRDQFSEAPPYQLDIVPGIAVVTEMPDRHDPRLPLLGLRAIRWNRLRLSVDGYRCRVRIATRPRLWLWS